MKKIIFVFLIAPLFFTAVFSQNTAMTTDNPVDFTLVEQSQELKYAFEGLYYVEEVNFDKMMPNKMNPVGKGALIGLGIGSVVGGLVGLAFYEGLPETSGDCSWLCLTGTQDSNSQSGFIFGGALSVGVLGTGLGALFGLAGRKSGWNSNRTNFDKVSAPEDLEYKTFSQNIKYYPVVTEVPIIRLNHSF